MLLKELGGYGNGRVRRRLSITKRNISVTLPPNNRCWYRPPSGVATVVSSCTNIKKVLVEKWKHPEEANMVVLMLQMTGSRSQTSMTKACRNRTVRGV
nr:hypothetical protein CFP56_37711 [Quercus suber]